MKKGKYCIIIFPRYFSLEDNCEKLAQAIVDSWDMEVLRLFAYESLRDTYGVDKDAFDRDCESINFKGN